MASESLGGRLRELRESKSLSLRRFARDLGISAAFLVDIEKGRRKPGEELLLRMADALGVPLSDFDQFLPTIPQAVEEWLQSRPILERAVKLLSGLPDPEKVVPFLERRLETQTPRPVVMAIYESELQEIGLESSSWDSETGGDLFGIWSAIPTIYLATKSGPKSVRDQAHFRLDVEYLIKLSAKLDREWGLRYFGDWHSHHRLGLQSPSGGDRRRIQGVAAKNGFLEMAEFIVTFASSYARDGVVNVHPYAYVNLPSADPTPAALVVLSGTSPVRQALLDLATLPEQSLSDYKAFAIDRVTLPLEPLPRAPGDSRPSTTPITDRAFRLVQAAIEERTSAETELHETGFGYVLVAELAPKKHVAFAIDRDWPHEILQANWLDRDTGTTEELTALQMPRSITAVSAILTFLDEARNLQGVGP